MKKISVVFTIIVAFGLLFAATPVSASSPSGHKTSTPTKAPHMKDYKGTVVSIDTSSILVKIKSIGQINAEINSSTRMSSGIKAGDEVTIKVYWKANTLIAKEVFRVGGKRHH